MSQSQNFVVNLISTRNHSFRPIALIFAVVRRQILQLNFQIDEASTFHFDNPFIHANVSSNILAVVMPFTSIHLIRANEYAKSNRIN